MFLGIVTNASEDDAPFSIFEDQHIMDSTFLIFINIHDSSHPPPTPHHSLLINKKMQTAAALLRSTNLPVSIIASKVGYPNFSYFSQAFKKQMGKAPNEYRSDAEI